MRRRSIVAILFLILALVLPVAVAAEDPPGPTPRLLYRVAGLPVAGPAEMVTFVADFPPGAATPAHTHPGQVLVTVLEGAITFRTAGGEKVYKVGESFIEPPGVVVTGVNTGTTRTRLMVSMVIPKGVPPSAPQPGGPTPAPAAPTNLYLARADAVLPANPYEVAQSVVDFVPGAQTPAHTHPGQVFVTVLEGEVTFRMAGGEKVYKLGESFIEPPGVVVAGVNTGTTRTTLLVTYLLPQGAALATPVATPGMPNTGAGGPAQRALAPLVALLLAGLLLAGSWGRRHRRHAPVR